MLKEGIIEKSTSPYSNPLVVVTKKDLSIRLCLDARQAVSYTHLIRGDTAIFSARRRFEVRISFFLTSLL